MNFRNLCIHCMKEKEDSAAVCAHCGFAPQLYQKPEYALPPFTILNGKYLIGCMLGAGGFGITYIAMDMTLERVVCIKEFFIQDYMQREPQGGYSTSFLNASFATNHVYTENKLKFEKEAKTLAHLEHLPGIVRVHDFFHENETSYIVMEYLSGQTLKQYVKSSGGRISIEEVAEKLKSVFESLDLVHKNHIIHRDISPDNVMVLADGSMKLFDFGGAKIQASSRDNKTRSMVILAKNGYSPVEQLTSTGQQGAWTDVYALAATVYYCICGKPPVDSTTRIANQDPLVPPHRMGVNISPETERVLMKGLAVSVADRYSSVREFEYALNKSLYSGRSSSNADDMSQRYSTNDPYYNESYDRAQYGGNSYRSYPYDASPYQGSSFDTERSGHAYEQEEGGSGIVRGLMIAMGIILIIAAGVMSAVVVFIRSDDSNGNGQTEQQVTETTIQTETQPVDPVVIDQQDNILTPDEKEQQEMIEDMGQEDSPFYQYHSTPDNPASDEYYDTTVPPQDEDIIVIQ